MAFCQNKIVVCLLALGPAQLQDAWWKMCQQAFRDLDEADYETYLQRANTKVSEFLTLKREYTCPSAASGNLFLG